MKVAIIGSRTIEDIDLAKFLPKETTVIVSGGAKGVDTIAEKYAKDNNIETQIFLPDYEHYGKNAPLIRNKLIVDNCDVVFAFWDGVSRGTSYTVNYANSIGKKVIVYLS